MNISNKQAATIVIGMVVIWLVIQVSREKADERIIHLGDADFAATIENSPIPVLVDFWAPWCGPCRRIQPGLNKLVDDMDDRMLFAKVNIDHAPQLAAEYAEQGIPLIVLFKDGEEVAALLGAHTYQVYKSWIIRSVFDTSGS
ncbi:MAG: thioredoxin domain-containing protein [Verrucomicrobiota bacterium]